MSVKVVAYTQLADENNTMNPSDFIAYVARVSNPSNQHNTETSDRLLKYLVKHKHWSPFEMAHVTMEINTTRDIARQTVSRLYMAGSVRSWIHYCQLRCANGTQKEHQLIALECWNELIKIYPSLDNLIDFNN